MTLLSIISCLVFFIGIGLQFLDKLFKIDFKHRKAISFIIITISALVFTISQIQSCSSRVKITQLSQSQEELCEGWRSLKNQMNDNTSMLGSKNYNGISYNLFLKVYKDPSFTKKYIVDDGENTSKNRLSIYLDENNNLNFRLIDGLNGSYKIKVKRSLKTFEFNNLFYLICEYGMNDDSSFIRIIINGNVVANQIIEPQITIPFILELQNRVIGANLNHNENASFGLAEMILRTRTWSYDEVAIMIDYFDKKPKIGFISFFRDDFMLVDKKTNGLIQPIEKNKPKAVELENCLY